MIRNVYISSTFEEMLFKLEKSTQIRMMIAMETKRERYVDRNIRISTFDVKPIKTHLQAFSLPRRDRRIHLQVILYCPSNTHLQHMIPSIAAVWRQNYVNSTSSKLLYSLKQSESAEFRLCVTRIHFSRDTHSFHRTAHAKRCWMHGSNSRK